MPVPFSYVSRLLGFALCLMAAGLAATPGLAGDAGAGREKAATCRTCHGIDGVARLPNAPHIAGESELYLIAQLRAFRSGERRSEIMAVIAQSLSDDDIADLAAWYSSIEFSVTLPD
ncbi:c-type cytochrome [Algihabitans albus]|uniref:c-type cytochrome n=1 Tax=Algihabitans albus TaxID=2164067 RepID=UPI000E5CCA51|nr:cytochrome c [Algihabitans albus]